MLEAVIAITLAYLLGAVSGSLLLGKLKKVDIRTMGSGNAGGTNALRSVGFVFALGVVIIDVGKGALATGWIPGLVGAEGETVTLCCGFAAVFGHCYPVWHGFRGGKGAATVIGTLIPIAPMLLLPMIGAWWLTLIVTGYVGVATVVSGFALVPGAAWFVGSTALVMYCLAVAVFMTFTHRSNFRNLRAGTEHRFEKVWIARWLGRSKGA